MSDRTSFATDRQLAEIFDVNRSTIWRWAANGTIPQPHRIGGVSRWDLSKVLDRIGTADGEDAR